MSLDPDLYCGSHVDGRGVFLILFTRPFLVAFYVYKIISLLSRETAHSARLGQIGFILLLNVIFVDMSLSLWLWPPLE